MTPTDDKGRCAAVPSRAGAVVTASLHALLSPPSDGSITAPREILTAVSEAWADDLCAWQLARELIVEADDFLKALERKRLDQPGDGELDRLRGRARYVHVVATGLYRDLRIPARRLVERSAAHA